MAGGSSAGLSKPTLGSLAQRERLERSRAETTRTPPRLERLKAVPVTCAAFGSAAPAVTKELALVGLNFDRNVQGLSRDYIYLPDRGRNIMVDARAVQAALDHAYDADRIVEELLTGRLFETEVEADRARR